MGEKDWFYNFVNSASVAVDTEKLRAYSKQLGGVCQNSEKLNARIGEIA